MNIDLEADLEISTDGKSGGDMGPGNAALNRLAAGPTRNDLATQGAVRRLSASAVSTSSSVPTVLCLGGPSVGRSWDVRQIVLTDITPFGTAITAPVVVFVTAGQIDPNNIDASSIFDVGSSVPVAFNYGRGQFVVQANEQVFVAQLASDTDIQYVANLHALEVNSLLVAHMRP